MRIGIKGFKFRLAEDKDMEELSGYRFNAVTPFFMTNETLPVVIDGPIAELSPEYIWMGGGRVSLKLGVSIPDLKSYMGDRLLILK